MMKSNSVFILLIFLILFLSSNVLQAQSSRIKPENNLILEAIGVGGFPSASIEFLIGNENLKFGGKLGIGMLWANDNNSYSSKLLLIPTIPLQFIGMYGSRNNFAEVSLGATYFHKLVLQNQKKSFAPTLFVAWRRYVSPRLFFRIGGGFFVTENTILLQPLLGVSYSLTGRIEK